MNVFSYNLDVSSKSIWKHISATAAAKASFMYLQEVGYFFSNKSYYTKRSGLESFLIKLTVSGGGIIEYGGNKEQVGPGQFFWIDCQNLQHYYTDPEIGHWDVIWVHFSGYIARAYYDAYRKMIVGGTTVGKTTNDSNMYILMETLLSRSAQPDFPFTAEQNLIEFDIQNSGILTQLIMECFLSIVSSEKTQMVPQLVTNIRNYITSHYNEKITLEKLASEFNLDKFYLQKLFRRYTGQSPIEYIIYLRMNRAARLIRTSDMPISEIANTVGIENLSHFTRQFKKLQGMTPSQFRKSWPNM